MYSLTKKSGFSLIRLLPLILFIAIVFYLFYPGMNDNNDVKDHATLREKIEQSGKIKVGMSVIVPWAMRNEQGDWIGYEIDVAEKFAADNGLIIEWVPTQWDGIIAGLLANRFDVIIGGMTITETRSKQVDFTNPYTKSKVQMVANSELTNKLETIAEYNNPKVRIAVRRGANTVDVAKKHFPDSTLLYFDDEPQSEQTVINGQAEAFVSTAPVPEFAVLKSPEKLFLPFPLEPLGYSEEGIAIRKNESDMLAWLNAWIAEQQESGWLAERHAYWFNTLDWVE